MTDVGMIILEPEATGDVQVAGGDLVDDLGLTTACYISLFSDGRAAPDEPLIVAPDERDLRGWWAGGLLPEEDDAFGSLLWLLERQKITTDVLNRAREVTQDALEWLVLDEIAEEVAVTVSRFDIDRLLIEVDITRGAATEFSEVWDGIRDAVFESGPARVKLLFR